MPELEAIVKRPDTGTVVDDPAIQELLERSGLQDIQDQFVIYEDDIHGTRIATVAETLRECSHMRNLSSFVLKATCGAMVEESREDPRVIEHKKKLQIQQQLMRT